MRCCTISKRISVHIIVIMKFILFTIEVVGCHHVQLCRESVKCLEDEKIRLDRFVNASRLRELDQLRMECNRKVVCAREELGCEYRQYGGMTLEYNCIEDLPLYDESYPLKSGTLLSPNYPNPISNEFRVRLWFPKNVTLKLTVHDIGYRERMLYLTVYSFQGRNWTKYTRLVSPKSQKSFHNAKIFDISLHAKRVWITYTTEPGEKPPVTIRCRNNDKSTLVCPPDQKPPQKPLPKSKNWLIYTVVISVMSTIIIVIVIVFIWKRFSSFGKCPMIRPQKHPEQRPDILTHFPSDGNIITGDILAHEFEAAATAAEAEENRNTIPEDVDEDAISHYETITVPHYTDFPERPRPSLPDIPTLPRFSSSYIEVLPR